jgi:hypothetical protein
VLFNYGVTRQFKGLYAGNSAIYGTPVVRINTLFLRVLRFLDDVSSNQVVGSSNLSGRAKQFKNLRAIAQAQFSERSENVAFFATFAPRGASPMSLDACRSMRPATKESFSGARCA